MKEWAGVGGDNVKRDWAAKKSSYHMAKSTTLILQESGRAGYNFQKNFLMQVDLRTGVKWRLAFIVYVAFDLVNHLCYELRSREQLSIAPLPHAQA